MDVNDLRYDSGGLRPRHDGKRLVDMYPYVNPVLSWVIHDRYGPCVIPYGFLSDGASGPLIADLCPEGWFAHDWRYLTGKSRSGSPCTKREADVAYAITLFSYAWDETTCLRQAHMFAASLIRCSALGLGGIRPWNTYRKLDAAKLPNGSPYWTAHMLPRAMSWDLPTNRTKDAIWRG